VDRAATVASVPWLFKPGAARGAHAAARRYSAGVTSFDGLLTSGLGHGACFVALDWVRHAVQDLLDFDPYPGTLNLRLVDADARAAWNEVTRRAALRLAPPPPERCGGRLFPAVVGPDIAAAVVVPDITGHPADVLELIAGVNVRRRLGLRDGDRVTVQIRPGSGPAREVEA
jgi:riboflavin kinase, archaea type